MPAYSLFFVLNGDKTTSAGAVCCRQIIPQLLTRKTPEEDPLVTTTHTVAIGDKLALPGRVQRHQVAK